MPTDELLSLPEIVRDLAEAQKRTEARVAELAEAQKRTEYGLSRLEAVVRELAVVLAGHGDALQTLQDQSARMLTDLGDLRGYRLEQKYAQPRQPTSVTGLEKCAEFCQMDSINRYHDLLTKLIIQKGLPISRQ